MSYTRWNAVRVTDGFWRTRARYSSKVPCHESSAKTFWFCSEAMV